MAQNIGSLEVDVVINNIDSGKVTKQIAEDLKNVETAAKQLAAEVDKPKKFNIDLSGLKKEMSNLPKIQKEAIGKLDKIYGDNTKQIQALNKELDRVTAKKGDAETVQNLKAEIEAREILNKEIEKQRKLIENSSITARIKEIQREMQRLSDAGQDTTETYQKLMEEAGRLMDIRGDVAAQTAILANDEGTIKAATSAMGGIKSAADTAKTSMELLGASSNSVNKVMSDLNGVTSIFNGLQAVSATLNKDSYARRMATIAATKVQTVVTNLLTKAHVSEAAAAKAATVATAAATAGLTLLIPILYNIITKFREMQQAQEDIRTGMADAGAPAIVSLTLLSRKWNELGDNMQDKTRFIAENQSEFEKLGASINSVADAENLLVKQKDTFIAALMAKAKATAAYNVLVEKQKELLEAQLTYGGQKDENGNYTGDTEVHLWTRGSNVLFNRKNRQEGNLAYLNEVEADYKEMEKKMLQIIEDAQKDVENAESKLGSIMADKETTNNYIAWMKKQKAVFDNYNEALQSENQGVKNFFTNELKKLQQDQGTSATTWRKFLEDLKNKPENRGNYDIMRAINQELLNDTSDPLKELMERQKQKYAEFEKLSNSTSEEIRNNAAKTYANLTKQGATYADYLKNLRDQYKGNAAAIKKINLELIETERQGLMDLFKTDFERAMSLAKDITAQMEVIKATRAAISDDDPLKGQKNAAIDDKIKSLMSGATSDLAGAQKSYNENLQNLLPERVRYENEVKRLRLQLEKETDEQAAAIMNETLRAAEIRLQMATNKEKIDNAKDLAAQLVRIAEKQAADIAEIEENKELTDAQKEAQKQLVQSYFNADLQILKGQYEDFDENFVNKILEATEEATAGQVNLFVQMINEIQSEINEMEKNGQQGSETYLILKTRLDAAKKSFDEFKKKGKKTIEELAKDKNLKKLSQALNDLGSELQNIGGMFDGIVADIMKITGQMLTSASSIINRIEALTEGTIQGLKKSAQGAAIAIRTVENASVILAIIEAALQVAMAIINAFKKNEESYEDRKSMYEAYISTLDTLIERERKLTETLTAQDAALRYSNIQKYYEDKIKIEREAAKDYLSSGASWKSHSEGYKLNEKLRYEDWENIDKALGLWGTGTVPDSWKKHGSARSGHHSQVQADLGEMYGNAKMLMELDAKDLKAIQEQAYETYAKLPEEMRSAIEMIIEADEAIQQLKYDEYETRTGISFESFADSFKDAMLDMEVTAKDISKNINEYLRKGLILDLYKKDFQKDIDEYYEKWATYMKDGELTNRELNSLNQLQDKIATGIEEKVKAINERFSFDEDEEEERGLSGAIKNASQESIDLLTGQTNAVRINQIEQIALNRQQLNAVMAINSTLIICRDYLATISGAVTSNQLRAQGVTTI